MSQTQTHRKPNGHFTEGNQFAAGVAGGTTHGLDYRVVEKKSLGEFQNPIKVLAHSTLGDLIEHVETLHIATVEMLDLLRFHHSVRLDGEIADWAKTSEDLFDLLTAMQSGDIKPPKNAIADEAIRQKRLAERARVLSVLLSQLQEHRRLLDTAPRGMKQDVLAVQDGRKVIVASWLPATRKLFDRTRTSMDSFVRLAHYQHKERTDVTDKRKEKNLLAYREVITQS